MAHDLAYRTVDLVEHLRTALALVAVVQREHPDAGTRSVQDHNGTSLRDLNDAAYLIRSAIRELDPPRILAIHRAPVTDADFQAGVRDDNDDVDRPF